MKKNLSSNDKFIRLGISIILIILFYKGVLNGIPGIISLVLAFYLTLTSLINICFIYKILGINTNKSDE